MSSIHIIDENSCHRDGKIYKDYECTLNQTDIRTNANKFYILQLIEKGTKYYVFIRYGRVGEIGRTSHKEYNNAESGVSFFISQFKSKTGNVWGDEFKPKKGKYWLCEMDYDDVEGLEDAKKDIIDDNNTPVAQSTLPQRVQDFLSIVSNVDTMNKTLISLNIDTKKMPLGKLSQGQLDKG